MRKDPEVCKAFGKHLIDLMEAKEMSAKNLEERSGVSMWAIYEYRYGDKNPTLTTLNKLAKGLGITKCELMDF